jgi:hypothetical protein
MDSGGPSGGAIGRSGPDAAGLRTDGGDGDDGDDDDGEGRGGKGRRGGSAMDLQ